MKILILDDLKPYLQMLEKVIKAACRQLGITPEIYTASSVEEAKALKEKGPYDLMFIDNDLGRGQFGQYLLATFRQENPTAAIYLNTSDGQERIDFETVANAQAKHIIKTSDIEEVRAMVEKAKNKTP